MTKAIFTEKQPEVRTTDLGSGMLQFQLCLHEEEVTVQSQSYDNEESTSQTMTEYQYDFNEFRTDALTEEEVKADPEKYLSYTPIASLPEDEQQPSIDARLKEIQTAQEETAQAVQDMLMMQMMEAE